MKIPVRRGDVQRQDRIKTDQGLGPLDHIRPHTGKGHGNRQGQRVEGMSGHQR